MAQDNSQLSAKIAQTTGEMTPLAFEETLKVWFTHNARRMETLAGSKDEARRIMATVVYVAQRNPKLLRCSMTSLGECLLHSASLKLYPGPLQECAYVPFKGVATFIPMYQGLCKLAYNSGQVRNINYNVVYEADDFDWEEGSRAYLRHKPNLLEKDRGKRLYVWTIVELLNGWKPTVLGVRDVEAVRARAPFGKDPDSPWNTDPDAMWVKTSIKRALKTVPKSIELAQALDADDAAEHPERHAKVIDIDTKLFDPVSPAEKAEASQQKPTEEKTEAKKEVK